MKGEKYDDVPLELHRSLHGDVDVWKTRHGARVNLVTRLILSAMIGLDR